MPPVWIEQTTCRLQGGCSATELRRRRANCTPGRDGGRSFQAGMRRASIWPRPTAANPTSRCSTWISQCHEPGSSRICSIPRTGMIRLKTSTSAINPLATRARSARTATSHRPRTSAAYVEQAVAVDVGHGDAGRGLEECAARQVLSDHAAELKGHAIARRELEVRHRARQLAAAGGPLGKALRVELRELAESRTPRGGHFRGGIIRAEEPRLVVLVVANESHQEPRETRVSGKRAVLGARQQQPMSRGSSLQSSSVRCLRSSWRDGCFARTPRWRSSAVLCLSKPPLSRRSGLPGTPRRARFPSRSD